MNEIQLCSLGKQNNLSFHKRDRCGGANQHIHLHDIATKNISKELLSLLTLHIRAD